VGFDEGSKIESFKERAISKLMEKFKSKGVGGEATLQWEQAGISVKKSKNGQNLTGAALRRLQQRLEAGAPPRLADALSNIAEEIDILPRDKDFICESLLLALGHDGDVKECAAFFDGDQIKEDGEVSLWEFCTSFDLEFPHVFRALRLHEVDL
ncbi:MAG: hypothetical protein AAF141_14415, partial [Pseudomonadota bacterium]